MRAFMSMSVSSLGPPRQPIHTLYGGAHLYRFDATRKLGALALRSLDEAIAASGGLEGLTPWLAAVPEHIREQALDRTRRKLGVEPIEDQRIDFEDGFGPRASAEEDAEAIRTAREVARGQAEGTLPPFLGIRIRSFAGPTKARALRTLRVFFETLDASCSVSQLLRLIVTLPKVEHADEAHALAREVTAIPGAAEARLELMIESPRALMDETGRCPLPDFIRALGENAFALHLGAYDLTSELGVPAPAQRLSHPACEQARFLMQCAAGDRIHVVDGATTWLPLRTPELGIEAVKHGWKEHGDNVRSALASGIYQGWDLHPAQLPIRYIAFYTYFLEARDAMAARLRRFLESSAKATRVGAAFDDAATGLALLAFFRRGWLAGAFEAQDLDSAGLTPATVLHSLADLSAPAVGGNPEGA